MLTRAGISQDFQLEGNFEYRSMTSSYGVRFSPTKEAALDPALRTLARSLPQSSPGLIMIAEMPGPSGIPDLIALPGMGTPLIKRLESQIPPVLKRADIEVIAALKVRQGITLDTLKSRVHRPERTVLQSVRNLTQSGAVSKKDKLLLRAEALQPVGHLYALEAKVDDWKKGVRQAFRYRSWCDASALILSQLPKNREPLLAAAQRLNIGLALEDRWLVRPRISKLDRIQRLWGSEHFVAALGFSPTKYPQI
ncbi:hypothetical protein [Streptomyces flaveolus]|uniref:hypothetical protein n=1 Tax=Streptomyces flaveolus TaxID=67297 RepID=UPI003701C378